MRQRTAEISMTDRELNRLPAEERYRRDPAFKTLVDVMVAFLTEHNTYTPTEVREAAVLAAIIYESTHIRPIFLGGRHD